MHTTTARLPYIDPLLHYQRIQGAAPSCLFESASTVDKSSRLSIIGMAPALELVGKQSSLTLRLLDARALPFFDFVRTQYATFVQHESADTLQLEIPKIPFNGPEEDRIGRQNIVQPLRALLAEFQIADKNFMGFYGALSYQFVYLFEDLPLQKDCPEPDFHLFLFDNILLFNHLTEDLSLYVTRASAEEAEMAKAEILQLLEQPIPETKQNLHIGEFSVTTDAAHPETKQNLNIGAMSVMPDAAHPQTKQNLNIGAMSVMPDAAHPETKQNLNIGAMSVMPDAAHPEVKQNLHIGAFSVTPNDETFKQQVAQGVQLCYEGELLEIVLSRKFTAPIQGELLPLYKRYKAINPSPYLFYFDFGSEVLLGASPEMMLRYENGRATLRPISGSMRRSGDPIEDHHLMMELLNSPKENSELDMLIDLGRNDLSRICKPGIEIDHYRIIEKYSHVTHTVAQLSGVLEDAYTGFDALIASLNAGTLTGAPKIAAMNYIEQIEQHTRGYYGGSIGWLLLNGDINTAITIRTAHIKDGMLDFSAGATLLYESIPENELRETKIKAGAFMAAVAEFSDKS